MGKKTDYSNGLYKDNEIKKMDIDIIERKIGKEALNAEEIALYLSENGNDKDSNGNAKPITAKTVKNRIGDICEYSGGLLSTSDFIKGGKYIVEPAIHGLLFTVLDTNYGDDRRNQKLLSYRENLYRTIIKNIEKYLDDRDKEAVKASPSYLNALVESELSTKLNNELIILLRNLYNIDSTVRYKMMKHVVEQLISLSKWVSKTDSHMFSTKLVFGAEIGDVSENIGLSGKLQKELFQVDSLEEYIIKLLSCKIHCEIMEEEVDDFLSFPAIYVAQKLYNSESENENTIRVKLDEIDKKISNQEKFKLIEEKAKKILNLNDNYEKDIYTALMSLAKVYFLAPVVSQKDYEKIVKYTQEAMEKDKWDIISEFCNRNRDAYSKEMLNKIDKIKQKYEEK